LASFQGAHVRTVPLSGAARIRPEADKLIIEVNEAHSVGKQNFSLGHEITHTLLPTYTGEPVDDTVTGEFAGAVEQELLCDLGAAALLLNQRWLRPMASEAGPSLSALVSLAATFRASLQATAHQLTEADIWPCAFVLWEEGYRKAEEPQPGQGLLPGFGSRRRPEAKLRARHCYASRSFGLFFPRNKSVEWTSLVGQCYETNDMTWGVEELNLGRSSARLYWECLYAPYKSGDDVRGRVISLLLPQEQTRVPSEQLLQRPIEAL
jgi:hypothetical protein